MKKPSPSDFFRSLAALSCLAALTAPANAQLFDSQLPSFWESYDNNPDGDQQLSETTGVLSRGYGFTGMYQATAASSYIPGSFMVVSGGLPFGAFNSSAGKCLQATNASANASALSILMDGGKAWGDTQWHVYDKFYCSYLINYSVISTSPTARSEVRFSKVRAGGVTNLNFQLMTDGGTGTGTLKTVQPALQYYQETTTSPISRGTIVPAAATPPKTSETDVLDVDTTYLVIGRFEEVGNTLTDAAPTGNWLANSNTITVSSATGIAVGQIASGVGIANNSRVTVISGTTITLDLPTSAASATSTVAMGFRTPSAVTTGTWAAASKIVTVANATGLVVGQPLVGLNIPANNPITAISGNQVTLGFEIATAGTNLRVAGIARSGTSTMFILNLAQYENWRDIGDTRQTDQNLDARAIGTGAGQIVSKVVGPPIVSGSHELLQGRFLQLVAQGSASSRQTYKIDEIRGGFTLRSVALPAAFVSGPADEAVDRFPYQYLTPIDGGSGWKSGFYILEETASPQGATVGISLNANISPGSGDALNVFTRVASSQDQGIRRRPDPAVVDMSQPYSVSFEFQPTNTGTFTAFDDRLQFGADGPATIGANFGVNPATDQQLSWLVGVVGAGAANRPMYDKEWYFYNWVEMGKVDGVDNPFTQVNLVRTGIMLQDSKYRFKIEVDPPSSTYKATITDLVLNTTFSRAGLKFKASTTVPSHSLFFGVSSPAGDSRSFNLDNLRVTRGANLYSDWADQRIVAAGANKTRTGDPDTDGKKNFLEYALDGNPASGVDSGKVRQGTFTDGGGLKYPMLTIPVRAGLSFSTGTGPRVSTVTANEAIGYTVQGSYNLSSWTSDVVEVTPAVTAGMPTLTSDRGSYTYKSFRLTQPLTVQPKGFLRAVVTDSLAP